MSSRFQSLSLLALNRHGSGNEGTHPEPVLVEDVAGDPDAGDARDGDESDEPAELRHAVGCAT